MRAIPAGDVLTELTIATPNVVRDDLLPSPLNDLIEPVPMGQSDDGVDANDANEERDAFAEGYEAGRREAEAIAKTMLEEEVARRDQLIEEARVSWSEQEGQALAQATVAALELMKNEIGESVAEILQPFVEEELFNRAVADMSRILEDILRANDAVRIEVSAREDLLQALQEIAPFNGPNFHMTPSSSNDFVCRVDDLQLKTQVEIWRSSLVEATE